MSASCHPWPVAAESQIRTQRAGGRPFGVGLLVAGYDVRVFNVVYLQRISNTDLVGLCMCGFINFLLQNGSTDVILPTFLDVSTLNTMLHSLLTVFLPYALDLDPLPIGFLLVKRLWISWFPRLRFWMRFRLWYNYGSSINTRLQGLF